MSSLPPPASSIIILNFNGRRFLEDCLGSVQREVGGRAEIILVDNGSSDGSTDFVRSRFPGVQVLDAGRNLGYAGGNNLGVRHARTNVVVLLNNDTVVDTGWLDGLLSALSRPDVAVASSLVRTKGIPDRYYEKNGSINFLGHNIMEVFDRPEEIFYCGGTSLAFRKDLLGIPFDEDYFAYAEDVYLSMRARFMGYRIMQANASRVEHYGGGTSGEAPIKPIIWMLQERNRLLNMLLFFSGRTLLKLIPYFIANMIAKYLAGLTSPRFSLLGAIHAHWWLFRHASRIMEKRRVLHREFRVQERSVLSQMSARLVQGDSVPARFLNGISIFYCRLVGLRTVELGQ